MKKALITLATIFTALTISTVALAIETDSLAIQADTISNELDYNSGIEKYDAFITSDEPTLAEKMKGAKSFSSFTDEYRKHSKFEEVVQPDETEKNEITEESEPILAGTESGAEEAIPYKESEASVVTNDAEVFANNTEIETESDFSKNQPFSVPEEENKEASSEYSLEDIALRVNVEPIENKLEEEGNIIEEEKPAEIAKSSTPNTTEEKTATKRQPMIAERTERTMDESIYIAPKEVEKETVIEEQAVSESTVPQIEYFVQFAASKTPLSNYQLSRVQIEGQEVRIFEEDGWYKYQLKVNGSYEKANDLITIHKLQNAFIVAYKDNKKIDMIEAWELIGDTELGKMIWNSKLKK